MKRLADILLPLAVAALLLGAWEWAVVHWQVPAYVLPAPEHQWSIVDLIVDLAFQSLLGTQAFETCAEDPSAAAATASCSAVPASVLSTPQTRI